MHVPQDNKTKPLEKIAERQIEQFQQNAQSTHAPEVENSTVISIKKLKARYETATTPAQLQNNLKEIKKYIDSLPSSPRKVLIITSYKRICSIPSENSATGLTLGQTLSLVWEGVNDKTAKTSSQPMSDTYATPAIIKLRREALLDKLYEIQTEYGAEGNFADASCVGGTRNALVATLNKAHPDVEIFMTSAMISLTATEYAVSFMKQCLQKEESIQAQREILSTWQDIEKETEEKKSSPAWQFHQKVKSVIDSALTEQYGDLLTAPMREGIMGDYTYNAMPAPIYHNKLNELMDEIRKISSENKCGIFLMAPPTEPENYKLSDDSHLYLYIDKENPQQIFYQFENKPRQYISRSVVPSTEEFDQGEYLIAYDNEEICDNILKITSTQGHNNKNHFIARSLQIKANTVFQQKHDTLEQDYQWLNKYYQNYKRVKNLFDRVSFVTTQYSHLKDSERIFENNYKEFYENLMELLEGNTSKEDLFAETEKYTELLEQTLPLSLAVENLKSILSKEDQNKEEVKEANRFITSTQENLRSLLTTPKIDEKTIYSFMNPIVEAFNKAKPVGKKRAWQDKASHAAMALGSLTTYLFYLTGRKIYHYTNKSNVSFFPVLKETGLVNKETMKDIQNKLNNLKQKYNYKKINRKHTLHKITRLIK